jgi:hypothetical protein
MLKKQKRRAGNQNCYGKSCYEIFHGDSRLRAAETKISSKIGFRLEMSAFIFITAWRLECRIAKAGPNG